MHTYSVHIYLICQVGQDAWIGCKDKYSNLAGRVARVTVKVARKSILHCSFEVYKNLPMVPKYV